MIFEQPIFFWLLVPLAALVHRAGLNRIRSAALWLGVAYLLLVVALAQPIIRGSTIDTQRYVNDVIVAVDLSYSMRATDIVPSRLEAAKSALAELINSKNQSRYAIVGFTTNAIILSPLSEDKELLLHLFSGLNDELVVTKGSSVMSALELSVRLSKSPSKSLLLITDGADESSYAKEADFAKSNGLEVSVLMTATEFGSSLNLKNGELLRDEAGNIVITRQNGAIKTLAESSGGVYTKSMAEVISHLAQKREDEAASQIRLQNDLQLFYYPAIVSLLILLLVLTSFGRHVKKALVPLFMLVGINLDASIFDAYLQIEAQKAYKSGDYERAAEIYGSLESQKYNAACSLYKQGAYDRALELFSRLEAGEKEADADLLFNIANTYVRLKNFEKAREYYIKALSRRIDKESVENYLFIENATHKEMITGNQKAKESQNASQQESSQKKKEGGGSNMSSAADASSGASDGGKKVEREEQFSLKGGKSKLSSTQYELINKRSVHETKPW